jgi:hypothetical protein
MSPLITKPSLEGYCLSFYYHMEGIDIGSLKIYAINNQNETLIYSKSSTQVNEWKRALVRMNSVDFDFDFNLAVDSVNGKALDGHIGFDEVSLLVGYCPKLNSYICTFEDDLCSK